MIPINIQSNHDIQLEVGQRFKKQRLLLNFSRNALSERSGVPYETIKKFESTGEISLKSLISLANALDRINEIKKIMAEVEPQTVHQIKNLKRKRGRV